MVIIVASEGGVHLEPGGGRDRHALRKPPRLRRLVRAGEAMEAGGNSGRHHRDRRVPPLPAYTEGDGDDDDDGEYKGPRRRWRRRDKVAAAAAPGEAPPRPSCPRARVDEGLAPPPALAGCRCSSTWASKGSNPPSPPSARARTKTPTRQCRLEARAAKTSIAEAAAPAGAPAPAVDDDNESFKPEKHGDDFVRPPLGDQPVRRRRGGRGRGRVKAGGLLGPKILGGE